MSTLTVTTKTCTRCGEAKPLDRFSPKRARRDGRQSWCKACAAANARTERATNPQRSAYDTNQRNAYNAALARLRDAQRDEFDRYYAEELAMRGLT